MTQLRAFDAICEAGSVTAAARRLRLTQPAVSVQLRALESEFGELFHRRGRRLVPTDAGARLFAISRRLFALEREAEDLLGAVRGLQKGRITVAADAPYLLVAVLAEFRARHPGIEVSVVLGNSQRVRESLLACESDAAIVGADPGDPRFHCVPYSRHRVVVLVGEGHPWARRRSVRLAELRGQPMIRREQGSATRALFETAAQTAGALPEEMLEIGSREAMREAVAAGLGIGVINEAELGRDDRLRAIPFEDADIHADEFLLCLADRADARLVHAFFEAAGAVRPG